VLGRIHRSNAYDVLDAWDTTRWCRCVVKTPRPDRRDDRGVRARLLREGRRLRAFAHPHLVRAWEVHDDPVPLVVLETLTGQTVSHLVDPAPRRIGAADAAWLGLHLVSAVHYLHGRGLLHLDLKPANVVAEAGRAVLIDLSVAAPPGRMRAGRGTWCYMAPEQARGGDVGPPADVWGLGVVLYEVLAGEPAYRDDDTDRPQLRGAPPPLRRLRRTAPPLHAVVDGCLSPDPADRPGLGELASALAAVAGTGMYGA
jgi:serine/threonine protein kinase